jgi:hypothetical protein
MTLAALASPEAPEIPSFRMCMQYGCQRPIIKQGFNWGNVQDVTGSVAEGAVVHNPAAFINPS